MLKKLHNTFSAGSRDNIVSPLYFCMILPDSRTYLLCLNSGSASFGGRIWRQITSQRCAKAVPIRMLLQMQPTNAAFFSLFLEDAPLPSFVASHIPRFARPKKKKDRDKMVTSYGVDRHFRGPGQQKSWCKGKTSGDTTGNAPKARPSHLMTVYAINKVSPKDSPSKTAEAGSFEGCRPWIETQQLLVTSCL